MCVAVIKVSDPYFDDEVRRNAENDNISISNNNDNDFNDWLLLEQNGRCRTFPEIDPLSP